MPERIPFLKRLLSYFYPLTLRKGKGEQNAYLELLLYRGRLQLATIDALYSDGDQYVPAVIAAKKLKDRLKDVRQVLVLGAGLGSMARVLHRMGHTPEVTLVDKDSTVLEWTRELAEEGTNIKTVHDDAAHFMEHQAAQYDLVFVDVFMGRVVPDFVCTRTFLDQCRRCTQPGGNVVLNYIVNNEQQWEQLRALFTTVYGKNEVVSVNINKILVGWL